MRKTLLSIALCICGILVGALNASADPIALTTYGGHTYSLYEAFDISWADAQAAAVLQGGYLAVLTTFEENTAVYSGLINHGFFTATEGQQYQAWLGGQTKDHSGSTTDPTNWAWVTGEEWTAFNAGNFATGEPNGDSEGLAVNRFGNFQYNDEGGLVGGYIVETPRISTPEGGTTAMFLGLGLGALGMLRRKISC